MSEATLTVRLPSEAKEQLAKLANYTRQEQDALGATAIADYVARELSLIEAIEAGRDDVRAGRVVSHDDVVREIGAMIQAARATR